MKTKHLRGRRHQTIPCRDPAPSAKRTDIDAESFGGQLRLPENKTLSVYYHQQIMVYGIYQYMTIVENNTLSVYDFPYGHFIRDFTKESHSVGLTQANFHQILLGLPGVEGHCNEDGTSFASDAWPLRYPSSHP